MYSEERQPLLPDTHIKHLSADSHVGSQDKHGEIKVYKRRWWILAVWSMVAFVQGIVWNTWGTVVFACNVGIGWTDEEIALDSGVDAIVYLFIALPMMYLTQTRGMRTAMVFSLCLLCMTCTVWLTAVVSESYLLLWFGSFFISTANGVLCIVAPLISVLWFPLNERTTATAIGIAFSYLGGSFSFITGPYISKSANLTESVAERRSELSADVKSYYKDGLYDLNYFNIAISVFTLTLVLIYFPDRPPKPPTHCAEEERYDFMDGIKNIKLNVQFWLLTIIYSVNITPFNNWLSLISLSMKSVGISQKTAGWLGFTSIIIGGLLSIPIGMFVDKFKKSAKLVLLLMAVVELAVWVLLMCIQKKYIIFASVDLLNVLMYILVALLGITVSCSGPLYAELQCDAAYPVYEGLACTMSSFFPTCVQLIFNFLFLNPVLAQDTSWMTWFCLVATASSLPMLCMVKQDYSRMETENTSSSQAPINS